MPRLLLLSVLFGVFGAPVRAQQPEQVLQRLFTEERMQAEWFEPALLAQVPIAQIEAIVRELRRQYGSWVAVRGRGLEYEVELERAWVPTRMVLGAQGRISGLLFQPPYPKATTLEGWLEAFRALPGRVALLVRRDDQDLLVLRAEEPLAVGSAFKVAVLAALAREVASGRRRWEELVPIASAHKSLPSGILQDWPEGAPLTLYSLAALMIAQSDNTATDHLLALLGRQPVERLANRNRPFLNTREAFALKNPANRSWLERFRRSDETGKRAILRELAQRPLPDETLFSSGPVALDVEWFFSARELAALLDEVAELPIMGINPGPAWRADWAAVAFKGGSEPGVLNLSARLLRADGRRFTVIATWNDERLLDEVRFLGLYSGLLRFLAALP